MQVTPSNNLWTQDRDPGGPELDAIQQPYTNVILAFFHYAHTPAHIYFKDWPANDLESIFAQIRLIPRRRRAASVQLGRFRRFRDRGGRGF